MSTQIDSVVTQHLIYFTAVCTSEGYSFVSHGSNFLEPFVKAFANESMTYNYGQMSPTAMNWLWSMTSTLRSIAALFGYLMLPLLMDRAGRRITGMFYANVLLIIAILF